jgi:hypothetical protein
LHAKSKGQGRKAVSAGGEGLRWRKRREYQVGSLNEKRVVEGTVHFPVLLADDSHLGILALWTIAPMLINGTRGGRQTSKTNLIDFVVVITDNSTSDDATKVPPGG